VQTKLETIKPPPSVLYHTRALVEQDKDAGDLPGDNDQAAPNTRRQNYMVAALLLSCKLREIRSPNRREIAD
jgi:hypothetical protein